MNNLELRTITLFKKVLNIRYPELNLNTLSSEEIIDRMLESLEGDLNE